MVIINPNFLDVRGNIIIPTSSTIRLLNEETTSLHNGVHVLAVLFRQLDNYVEVNQIFLRIQATE